MKCIVQLTKALASWKDSEKGTLSCMSPSLISFFSFALFCSLLLSTFCYFLFFVFDFISWDTQMKQSCNKRNAKPRSSMHERFLLILLERYSHIYTLVPNLKHICWILTNLFRELSCLYNSARRRNPLLILPNSYETSAGWTNKRLVNISAKSKPPLHSLLFCFESNNLT